MKWVRGVPNWGDAGSLSAPARNPAQTATAPRDHWPAYQRIAANSGGRGFRKSAPPALECNSNRSPNVYFGPVPQDFVEINARKPVAHVRFHDVEEWQAVVRAAELRGLTLNAFLRIVAIEAAHHGIQQGSPKADRALAIP